QNLIDACGGLALPGGRPWVLRIAGSGDGDYARTLQQRAEGTVPDAGRIEWLGSIDAEARTKLFADSDVLVLPSHMENFGMVVVEALAAGVPVIASDRTPWKSLEERDCGKWVPNGPESLRRAITALADAPLADMGARGRAFMEESFSWETVAGRFRELYASMLRNGPLPGNG
ncbi:MAG: glycosyltransferase, partial [Myxococcales bacterium]|nr:glycosyltransferase [Myxococcales bacterium]